MNLTSLAAPNAIGFLGGREFAEMQVLSVDSKHCDISSVLSGRNIQEDTCETCFIVLSFGRIKLVLRDSRYAEVLARVIKCVSVGMVTLAPISIEQPKNFAVHINRASSLHSIGVIASLDRGRKSTPAPLTEKLIVAQRHFRNLATGQMDFTVGLFSWASGRSFFSD